MIFLLLSMVSWAVPCPKEDLYAVGLNAYVIKVEERELSLEMKVETGRLSEQDVVDQWRALLQSCQKKAPQVAFESFLERTEELFVLGEEFQEQPFWALRSRRKIRLEIREKERDTALSYASFLQTLQRETGIAVKWKKDEHILAQGVISTARGSDLVADYIVQMWEK